MRTPVARPTTQCWPDKLSQPEAALTGAAPMPGASAAANANRIFMNSPPSMLFGDGGRVHRPRLIAPAGSYVGAKGGNLFVVEANAELEAAHLRPGAIGERRLMRAVQDDVDESRRIRRLQDRVAGERRRRLRRIGICNTRHTETRRQMTVPAARGVNDLA